MRTTRPLQLTVAAATLALAVTACGAKTTNTGSTNPTSGGTASSSPSASGGKTDNAAAAKAALPKAIKDKGTITVASDETYPPIESVKGTTAVGLDPDLAAAMGAVLGVKFKFVNSGFDGIVPAVKGHRYDIAMSAMSDTKVRQQVVNFVDYFSAGTSVIVAKGNPKGIKGLDATMCGLTVAAEKGTVQIDEAKAQSKKCPAGKPITVNAFPDQTGVESALQAGRADAVLSDSPVNALLVSTSGGKFEAVPGALYDSGPYGIAVPKDSPDLQKALQLALQAVIDSGQYKTILAKWKLSDGAIKTVTINAGT
ncbi:MAG: polar amino acid transport system substrate-binding protein [Frankiaceae bacterium]|nr:polar amino acid transport system substrate-binding protein [Frankiaceae bacterium]